MTQLTTEQATALLAAEPFVILRVMIDEDGYLSLHNWPAIPLATNVLWSGEDLEKLVRDEQPGFGGDLRSCQAVYLCHLRLESEDYPQYGSFWELVGAELIATEPFIVDDGTGEKNGN